MRVTLTLLGTFLVVLFSLLSREAHAEPDLNGRTFYEVLGIPKTASMRTVEKAFEAEMEKYQVVDGDWKKLLPHRDFLNGVRTILKDSEKRRAYDWYLRQCEEDGRHPGSAYQQLHFLASAWINARPGTSPRALKQLIAARFPVDRPQLRDDVTFSSSGIRKVEAPKPAPEAIVPVTTAAPCKRNNALIYSALSSAAGLVLGASLKDLIIPSSRPGTPEVVATDPAPSQGPIPVATDIDGLEAQPASSKRTKPTR